MEGLKPLPKILKLIVPLPTFGNALILLRINQVLTQCSIYIRDVTNKKRLENRILERNLFKIQEQNKKVFDCCKIYVRKFIAHNCSDCHYYRLVIKCYK